MHEIVRREGWYIFFLIVFWALFFSRILVGGMVYFFGDVKTIYYPLEYVYAEFQHQGHLPQWSELFGFGQPLLHWGQLGFFTPLNLLLRALYIHPLLVIHYSLVGYFLIGIIGMYAFLRQQRYSSLASTIGALVFTFNGFSISHLLHVNYPVATMLLPWLLWSLYRIYEQPTRRKILVLTAVAASIMVSGQQQMVLYVFVIASIVVAGWLVALFKKQVVVAYLISGLLAAGLSAVSILPVVVATFF